MAGLEKVADEMHLKSIFKS